MSTSVPPYIPPRPRAAELLDLPKELFIRISRFLSTKSLLNFVLVNREINKLCTLVLETPTAEGGELQRAIDWHATHKNEEKLMRILRNSRQMLLRHHESQFEALTYACAIGFENTVQWLLDIGINPDIRSSDPNKETVLTQEGATSPLMAVALRNDTRFLAQFLGHVGKPTGYYLYEVMSMLFGFPANIKDHEGAQLLVNAGLDCGIIDGDGATALHYAATYYSGEEVRFLAEQGLDIQAQAVGGATPLAYAINAGNVDTVEALCALEAPVNQQCTATNFPLALAARKGDPAIVKLLLDHGANPNLPNHLAGANGEVPLNDASLSSADTPDISAMSEKSALTLLHGGASLNAHLTSTENMLWCAMSRRWTTFLRKAFRVLQATNGPILAADAFFIAAAHLGDIQLLEALRATGTVNPNYLLRATPGSLHGMSALWEAIDFGPEAVVEWLIQCGGVTRFDIIDRQHNNLYHRALRWNHPNRGLTIRYLLDRFDPDELISPNTDKVTPLEMAIETQPYEMIDLLLSRIPPIGSRLLRREDFSYPLSVCLCTATRRDRLDVLQLLAQWMDVNGILLRPELPPLFTALQNRRHQIALWLIQQDISLDISVNNIRPISAAAALGFNDIVQILLAKGVPVNSADPEDRSALVAALSVGNLPAARLLLDAGADTNVHIDDDEQFTEKGKETLLLWAAARNHPETVRFLLERGWDVNGNYVGFGTPPLGYAAANNRIDCMRVLIEYGADLEYCDVDGFTPLYHAAWGGNPEALQILLDAGADPDPFDPYGNSPLIRAAAKSHEVTRLLVEAGVDVNEQSNAGSTALINAAARDQAESVHLLIQHGADLEKRLQGRTALAWAIRENSLRAAQVLVRAGADITALDEQGNTPLSLVRDDRAFAVLAEARGF